MNTEETYDPNNFSNELIIAALASSPAPTSIYAGENMIIQFANDGMLALWGKDASVIGKPLIKAIPELEGQPFLSLLQQVWRTGKSYSVSNAPAKLVKNGTVTTDYFDYEYKALLNKNGETWCILNTALEVTARREFLQRIEDKEQKEQALNEEMAATLEELTSTNEELSISLELLAESKQHVRTIIEQAPVGIAMLQGPEHIIEIANTALLKIWGREESEVLGLPHAFARPEMVGQPVNEWLREVYESGKQKVNNEFLVKLYNRGALREAIVNSIYQPIFSPQGEVTGVLIIIEEVTQQILERRRNEKDQTMLKMAIDAGELATFYYEPSTNYFYGNTLLKDWFGLPADESLDLSFALDVIVPEDRERVTSAINYSLSESADGHYAIEYRIQSKQDQNIRLVQATGRVFYNAQGVPTSLNGTLRDITEQKKDEQRKDDFIGIVSHELKTPLTSLSAYLQLLQRNAIRNEDKNQQGALEKSLRQIHKMNAIITSFLNVSRLDSGRMVIEKSDFDLGELFAEIEEELHATVNTHKIIFEPSNSLMLFADREKISQVLYNLIGNAVKYSPMGSEITIRSILTGNNEVRVDVRDEGVGITKDDQTQIFERYYRVKGDHTHSISGFGIGLYLCKEIINLHQGQIEVQSDENKGTIFSFILPG